MDKGFKSPETMKLAGDLLYEQYYTAAASVLRKRSCSRKTTVSDMVQTWFVLMLGFINRRWNPDKETLVSFIERYWYNTTRLAWRFEHGYNRSGKSALYFSLSLDELIEDCEGLEAMLGVKPSVPLFEEYEEFDDIVSKLPLYRARLLRDRLYLDLKPREMSKKYGIKAHSVSTMFISAKEHYQRLLEEKKKNERQEEPERIC